MNPSWSLNNSRGDVTFRKARNHWVPELCNIQKSYNLIMLVMTKCESIIYWLLRVVNIAKYLCFALPINQSTHILVQMIKWGRHRFITKTLKYDTIFIKPKVKIYQSCDFLKCMDYAALVLLGRNHNYQQWFLKKVK